MLKEKWKTWSVISNKLGEYFSRLPFSANFYTWMTLPCGFLGLLSIAYNHVFAGIVWFLLSGFFDIVDGGVARARQQPTYRGAFVDGSLDRWVDFFVILAYFWIPLKMPLWSTGPWICGALFLAIMPSFEVAYANHRKAVDDPTETKIWRILNRGEMYPLMLTVLGLSVFSSTWAGYTLVALVLLSGITTVQTFYNTLKLSSSEYKL